MVATKTFDMSERGFETGIPTSPQLACINFAARLFKNQKEIYQ